MQAVLTNPAAAEKQTLKSKLCGLFEDLESADNSTKNAIENDIVNIGEAAIGFLIDKLTGSKGIQRGVAAMSLIRIGDCAVDSLRNLAQCKKNYSWVANYIINEIEGTI